MKESIDDMIGLRDANGVKMFLGQAYHLSLVGGRRDFSAEKVVITQIKDGKIYFSNGTQRRITNNPSAFIMRG